MYSKLIYFYYNKYLKNYMNDNFLLIESVIIKFY